MPPWKLAVKRFFDVWFSFAMVLLWSPLLALIAVAVKLTSAGPLLFSQERIGYRGQAFQLFKFRTMVKDASSLGGFETCESDPRITPIGKILRRWSLDEFPQFWNIFKGEISLVGPRPTLRYQTEAYSETQKRRLLAKPGMTGLAQVSGRNQLSWPERIELDLEYIETFSLWKDLNILIKTFFLVLSGKGVYRDAGI